MARTVTRQAIRALARLYSDQRPGGSSAFITDDDCNLLINLALAELYDLQVKLTGRDSFAADDTITLVAGTATYALASDVYQLLSVDIVWSADEVEPLRPVDLEERAMLQTAAAWGRWSPKGYRLLGTQAASANEIEIVPTPREAATVSYRYIPAFSDLSADSGASGTIDCVNGWEKLVALKVAIEMRAIERETSDDLTGIYSEQLARVESMADKRQANQAPQVVNVHPEMPHNAREFLADRRWL